MVHLVNTVEQSERKIHFHFRLVPEYVEGTRKVSSVLCLIRDITQLKAFEENLNAKNLELRSINQYLDSFVYTVAHDLRSPITNLRLIADLMLNENPNEEMQLYRENMLISVNRMEGILNGFIDIINAQFNIQSVSKKIELEKIMDKVKEDLILLLKSAGAEIYYDFEQCQAFNFIEPYLSSIFRNLLSNSIKYRSENRPLKIEIHSSKSGDLVQLTFRDNGIGIDLEKNRRHLFKPFKRFVDNISGKGIGLHIVKSMVEKNGGHIELDSTLGEGTEFRLYLKEYIPAENG